MKKVKLHGGSSNQSQPPISLPSAANVKERGKQITGAVGEAFQEGSKRFDNIITSIAETPVMKSIERQTVEQPQQSSEQQIIFKELAEMRSILESLLIP
tara:strand:+ start:325 stop:621 length:297 start_codon:yes stop_codon:yes gene_type:complete